MWLIIGVVGIFLFGIYVIYKQIEFFVTARSLYKSILNREDQIISLLFDIRDNKKAFTRPVEEPVPEFAEEIADGPIDGPTGKCKHCGQEVLLDDTEVRQAAFECPSCGKTSAL